MPSGIEGAHNRVGESRYRGRIRETSLERERADDQGRPAEPQKRGTKQKGKSPGPQDTLDLHSPGERAAEGEGPMDTPEAADKRSKQSDNGHAHVDITA